MTDQERVIAIIQAIQDQNTLLLVLKALITNNLPNASSEQLTNICTLLGIN